MLNYKDLLALPQASEPENPYNVQRVGRNFRVLFTRRDGKLSTRAKWALEAGKTGIVQA